VFRFVKNRKYASVRKLEKKAAKANIKYAYRKALRDNPQLQKNVAARIWQKHKIKRQYAKKLREAKRAGQAAKRGGSMISSGVKAVAGFVKRHPMATGITVLILLFTFALFSMVSSFSSIGGGGFASILTSTHIAPDADIDNTELIYTEWETDLRFQIASTESDRPGYDEYRYNIGDISHNPYELMAYLTAMYQNFKYEDVQTELQSIFAEQYSLTFTPTIETRYRTVTGFDTVMGEIYEYEVAYEWHVLTTTLTARSFADVIFSRMTTEQRQMHTLYMTTKGNRQYVGSPFDFNWLPYVTSNYGYRVHPTTGAKDYHMGIDIGVPVGTEIHAGHNGTVTTAGYDAGGYGYYVVIEDGKGLVSKYAHCDVLLVNAGQTVKKGDVIAKSGNTGNSTGAHLHFEVSVNGSLVNPLRYL